MVVFTCQYCNSSLRRNAIEKHYTLSCRKAPALTCMDCLKDFLGDEYVGHLTCITEDEKYGGSNFVPKQTAVKQNKWLEACRSVGDDPALSSKQYSLIQIILKYDNIPRNSKKFHNFVMNVSRQHSQDIELVNSVLKIFENAAKRAKGNGENGELVEKDIENEKVENKLRETGQADLSALENSENVEALDETWKKKRKKSKIGESITKQKHEVGVDCLVEPIVKETKVKHKKGKTPVDGDHGKELIEERNGVSNGNSCEDESKTNKQKKAKSRESKSEVRDLSSCDNQPGEDVNQERNPNRNNKRRISQKKKRNETNIGNTNKDEIETEPHEQDQKEKCEEEGKGALLNGGKETSADISKLSKKERKRKLKQLRYEAELESIENFIPEDDLTKSEEEPPKSKKKKLKSKGRVSSETPQEETENKMEVENTVTFDMGQEEEPKEKSQSGKFDWGEVIIEILKSRSDKEMSLKRLGKKVITEYLYRKDTHETYEKLLAKFNKKVQKTVGVRVLKDCAKLIPSENNS